MRLLTSLDELDEVLAECERAAQVSDDELRRVFQTFRMDVSAQLPADPFSAEYAEAQMALYQRIAGRHYTTSNEESNFDLESAVARPFPYTSSCQIAGAYLSSMGFLLRNMHLRPGARVLDTGPGWGNTTLALAQLGFEVTALDIEPRFCELIRRRALQLGVEVEVVNSDFFWIERVADRFDAIVTFECFHHCADHQRLLRAFGPALAPGGHVYFGAEPITADFPVPWGLRTDGESLWAIRRNGWFELGFQPGYFRRVLRRAGLIAQRHTSADVPWISVWDAKVGVSETVQIAASDPRLATLTGIRENGAIRLHNGPAGYALYGPYVPLPEGRYLGRVYFRRDLPPKGSGVIDVCADAARKFFGQMPFDAATLPPEEPCVQIAFALDADQEDVQIRLYCAEGFSGCVERVELVEL
ncbi:MAG: class I SAM-dependent methyltransferase [Verrucomicrobia bacterium]|nr:class I SAM-dependent methyltransferase [Verrucomicrobiota bacterium]